MSDKDWKHLHSTSPSMKIIQAIKADTYLPINIAKAAGRP